MRIVKEKSDIFFYKGEEILGAFYGARKTLKARNASHAAKFKMYDYLVLNEGLVPETGIRQLLKLGSLRVK